MQHLFCFKAFISIIVLYSWPIKSDDIANFVKPTTPPKYFAIDVDGTFYTDNQEVFKKNTEAFKLLKDKNITPFFCTGRGTESNKKVITTDFESTTGYKGYPGVYNNGAVVYDKDGNIIKIEKLSVEFLDKFNEYATQNSINNRVFYSTDENIYSTEQVTDETKDFCNSLNLSEIQQISYDELKQKNVVSISTYRHPLDDFSLINDVYYVKYKYHILHQLLPKGTSKKTGLEALLAHYKSNGNECVYIGDDTNDHEAMDYCYVSFAVGNADDATKQKAKWVLDIKHDEGAFEKAVNLLCSQS